MHDHFDYWSRITPEREFGIDVARRLSYADAAVEVARLCSALHGAGIGAGCRLAIISRNRIEYALVSFAASKLGAVVVPVNVRLAAEELRFVLSDAGARCAFVDAPFQATLAGVRGTLSELGCVVSIGTGNGGLPDGMIPYENFLASASAAPTARRAQPSDDAVQYYTSGTAGKPNGVVHGHIALAVAASYWRSVFPIGANQEFGNHYLDAVRSLREKYPEAHIFGGHSNASFGLPGRKILNNAFISLAVLAGCDSLMIDPVMNPTLGFIEFKLGTDVLIGKDEFSMDYIKYWRSKDS